MSSVTKGQLAAQNAELLEAMKKLEIMNLEAMALARRARNDTDDVEREAVHFKQQRDRLIGYVEGQRPQKPIDVDDTLGDLRHRSTIFPVDAFLGECREDPPIRDGASPRRL